MSRLYDCYGGPGTSKEACGSCDVCLRMRILELEIERDALKAWKESAMAIEREWDEQALAFMLGVPLGQSVRMGIAEKVPEIIARVKRLEDVLVAADRYITLVQSDYSDYHTWICNTADARTAYAFAKQAAKESKP